MNVRKGKMSIVLVLALVMSLGLATSAMARMGMGGCGMMGGMMNLTPDQAGKLFDLKEKFRNDTADLRKQMFIKRAEMAPLWKAENPDQKQIQAKQKEVNALRDQLQEKAVAFRLEARKIAPQAGMGMGGGCGMGMGPGGGMGMGMGPGGGMAPAGK